MVGQRVVVRRLLPGHTGPTGGPAFTDVLGVCLSWADGECVVQPEEGPAVAIAVAEIVSGKPVPPRRSARLRVSAREAHLRGTALWPDLETEPVGEWLLRSSATATNRRANSVLAVEPAGLPGEAAIAAVVAFYDARGKRPTATVIPGSAEEELLSAHCWVLESTDADTLFQLASVAQARRAAARLAPTREVAPQWVETEETVTVRLGDHARGVAAYADDWLGIRSVDVDPGHRGQGLGLAVVSALLDWGAERGATTAYLQVLADNAPAIALYERLGFTTHHAYRYLAAPLP